MICFGGYTPYSYFCYGEKVCKRFTYSKKEEEEEEEEEEGVEEETGIVNVSKNRIFASKSNG